MTSTFKSESMTTFEAVITVVAGALVHLGSKELTERRWQSKMHRCSMQGCPALNLCCPVDDFRWCLETVDAAAVEIHAASDCQ